MAVASILDFDDRLPDSLLDEVMARCDLPPRRAQIACRRVLAVCPFCGKRKTGYDALCSACGRAPASAPELARSLLLSSDFQWDAMGLPKSREELTALGECIASGRRDCLSEEDINAVIEYSSELDAYRRRWTLPMVLLFWFTPAMLFLAVVIYLVVQVIAA